MTIDPDGNANIAFVDGINDCVGPSGIELLREDLVHKAD